MAERKRILARFYNVCESLLHCGYLRTHVAPLKHKESEQSTEHISLITDRKMEVLRQSINVCYSFDLSFATLEEKEVSLQRLQNVCEVMTPAEQMALHS